MSFKKSILISFLSFAFASLAYAASDCTYSSAQSRNLIRTISLLNKTTNGVLSFNNYSPTGSNPTMAWDTSMNKSSISSGSDGTVNLGICCNDQNASPMPVQLVYNLTQGNTVSTCTMNLTVKCLPTIELVHDTQSCQNNAANISADWQNVVNTSYTFTDNPSSTKKRI